MDDVISDGDTDDVGPSFSAIYDASDHRDCDCDVGWDGGVFFGDCSWYYYYHFIIILLLLSLISTQTNIKYKI